LMRHDLRGGCCRREDAIKAEDMQTCPSSSPPPPPTCHDAPPSMPLQQPSVASPLLT
uniref:Os01g0778700 protein n=1 Tax=Hydatigena taeniaeformis TaxID=6205 RepID=A0A0R3WW40_HYDTA